MYKDKSQNKYHWLIKQSQKPTVKLQFYLLFSFFLRGRCSLRKVSKFSLNLTTNSIQKSSQKVLKEQHLKNCDCIAVILRKILEEDLKL